MTQQTGDKISVECACGKKLKAPATAIGRKAKCPACGNVLTIEAPPPPPVEDDALGALYDLADAEKDAAKSNQVDDSPRCPQCAAEMAPSAVLCVNCGYDVRTKSKLAAKPVVTRPVVNLDGAKSSKKPKDKMAPEGKFIVGLGLSAAFATGVALIWYVVTWKIGWDIFYLSALIGIAAGIGMQMGQKGYSKLGGVGAAGVTMAVILITRVAMVFAILAPESSGHQSGLDKYDEHVVSMLVEQNLKSAGVEDPDDASDTQTERAEKAALTKLKGMSDSEYQGLVKQAKDKEDIDELTAYKAEEALKGKNPSNLGDALKMHTNATKTARAQVTGMTSAQRQAELTRLRSAQAAEDAKIQEEISKNKSHSTNSSSGSAAVAVGAAVILLLIFGLWPLLVMILAMSIAYKTAAGVVSG
jgi:hypothetical protein